MSKKDRVEKIRESIIDYGNMLFRTNTTLKDCETIDSIISLLYTIKHQIEKNIKNRLK